MGVLRGSSCLMASLFKLFSGISDGKVADLGVWILSTGFSEGMVMTEKD